MVGWIFLGVQRNSGCIAEAVLGLTRIKTKQNDSSENFYLEIIIIKTAAFLVITS